MRRESRVERLETRQGVRQMSGVRRQSERETETGFESKREMSGGWGTQLMNDFAQRRILILANLSGCFCNSCQFNKEENCADDTSVIGTEARSKENPQQCFFLRRDFADRGEIQIGRLSKHVFGQDLSDGEVTSVNSLSPGRQFNSLLFEDQSFRRTRKQNHPRQ